MAYTVKQVARQIMNAGGTFYLVGGAVRDKMMQLPAKDRDYCVTGLTEQTFLFLFPEALKTGEQFPVFRLEIEQEECEVALARRERKIEGEVGHQAFIIEADTSISIEDDLSRRDLSFNAMAIEISAEGEECSFIDPFGGLESIQKKEVNAIFVPVVTPVDVQGEGMIHGVFYKQTSKEGEYIKSNFTEDPLRVYRALRFASRYDYTITEETRHMMKSMAKGLTSLSAERVYDELCKTLQTKKPSAFFKGLKDLQLLHVHFPSWDGATEDQFQMMISAINDVQVGTIAQRIAVLFALVEQAEISLAADRIKMPTIVRDLAKFVSANHRKIINYPNLSAENKVELLDETRKHPLTKRIESAIENTGVRSTNWVEEVIRIVGKSYGHDLQKTKMSFDFFQTDYDRFSNMKITLPLDLKGPQIGEYIQRKKIETIKKPS